MDRSRRSIITRSVSVLFCIALAPGAVLAARKGDLRARLQRLFGASTVSSLVARRAATAAKEDLETFFYRSLGCSSSEIAAMTDRTLLAEIARAIQIDFSSGSMVDIGGWQVAEMEAHIICNLG